MAFPNKIIVVGGSAGGVAALPALLESFPADFPAALLVVLHIPMQADDLLAGLIQRKTALSVHTAVDGQEIEAGHVYLAAPDHHLLIEGKRVRLSHGPRENRHRPAINPLFRSAAKIYGEQVIGVLITGQLDDGVIGLNAVKTHRGRCDRAKPGRSVGTCVGAQRASGGKSRLYAAHRRDGVSCSGIGCSSPSAANKQRGQQ